MRKENPTGLLIIAGDVPCEVTVVDLTEGGMPYVAILVSKKGLREIAGVEKR